MNRRLVDCVPRMKQELELTILVGEARLRPGTGLRRAKVELQGIEPWSREDKCVRSTCLVDFNCREMQGRQQP